MINRLFLSLVLVLTATIATAQTYKINGQVVDEKNHPLPYAVIAIEGKGNVAAADQTGSFSLNLKSGSYLLRASLLGYKTTHKRVNLSKNSSVTIQLKEDYKQLGEVLVVGPDHAKQMQEGVYAAKSLNVRPYAASNNSLNNLLGQTSGVRIREEGGIGSNFDLTLTGLSGNAIRYFIDGVPLTSLGSGTNVANLPINIIDRVEIYKGVVPPELGLDALGGAVNIITRKENKNYLEASINGGSFHTYGANLSGEYRVKSNGFTVRGNGSLTSTRNNYMMRGVDVWNPEANEYQTGDYRRFHDGYRSINGEIQAGFTQTKWADEALIGVYYANSKSEIQTGLSQKLVIGDAERYRDALRVSLNYSKRNLLVKGLTAKLFASHTLDHVLFADTTFRKYFWDGSFLESNRSEITQRGKMLRHIKRPTTVVRGNLAYRLTNASTLNLNYTLTANHNNRSDSYDEDFIPTSDFLARHIIGLSYSSYWWGDRINSTLFLKDYILQSSIEQEDMYWITGVRDVERKVVRNNIGYGLGARVTFAKEISLKLSYENATRLPTARELFGNGASIYPNFKLNPERAHNLNLALYGAWRINSNHSINYEGTFFMRDVKDYIRRDVISEGLGAYKNVGAARVFGGEVDLKYRYKNLIDFGVNATYVDERNRSEKLPDGRIDITYNNRIPNKPFFYTNSSLGISFQEPFGLKESDLRINASYGYVHWFYLSWAALGSKSSKAIIPTQSTTDIGATWSWNKGKQKLSINCNNLFDQINYDNYMLQKPGRSLFCKLTTFFN